MRNFASILVIALGAGIVSLPMAWAQDQNNSTSEPNGKVQQHQEAKPTPQDQNSATRRDQSAQAPQSPAVITPPSTGDKSVITPPATGDATTPVIPPPGTPGGNDEVQPK
ncbi:MAG TPA: hypothetical protein VGL83_02390 [Stellaceae bacterium]|jgi:cytoskeletal protein RodZ